MQIACNINMNFSFSIPNIFPFIRTDKYPKLLKATLKLLINYQDSNSVLGKSLDGKDTGLGASFVQKGK
jgi:hypothetical protein